MYFSGFLNERLIFYELFCEEPSALLKYALMVVRGLTYKLIMNINSNIYFQFDVAIARVIMDY